MLVSILLVDVMNGKQRYALVVTASIIFLMLLFPPFHLKVKAGTENIGYGFIFTSPKSNLYTHLDGSVDVLTLFIQIVAISVAGCFLSLAFKDKN